MLLKTLIIFWLFLAIGICETYVKREYSYEIRDDYCEDYCANECKVGNASEKNKTCTGNKTTVITDKYEILYFSYYPWWYQQLLITWKANMMNLAHLKRLDSSLSKKRVYRLFIHFDENLADDTLFQSDRYMRVLNLYYVDTLVLMNLRFGITIQESEVNVSSGPKSAWVIRKQYSNFSTFVYNYLSKTKSRLQEITISGPGTLLFRNDTFEKNPVLESIEWNYLTIQNLNTVIFENLTKIRTLQFYKCNIDNYDFLRSNVLKHNLESIELRLDEKIDLKYFENYRKLKRITVLNKDISYYIQNITETNVTAFLCPNSFKSLCHFNLGIRGKRCPSACTCEMNTWISYFIITCTQRGLTSIPDLPIPVIGNACLLFEGNGLTQLPNTSSEGYDNLVELHLANNKLETIQMNQLPKKLKWLDIRNNSIISLDSNVAAFLLEQRKIISVLQSEILWRPNCKNTNLLRYLALLRKTKTIEHADINYVSKEYNNSVHFYHLKGPCPDDCICCVDGTKETQFIINCTSKGLEAFPDLTKNLSEYTSLLLDNNLIETFPIHSLRNSTLNELHLMNTSLVNLQLDQIPFNISVLDIRRNNLTGLDDDVTQFISTVKKVQLSENPWQCSCKFKKFLAYLRKNDPREYNASLGRCSKQEYCPDRCICCKEDESERFIIDCRNLGLMEIPTKLPIAENAALLFDNNELRSLNNSTYIYGFHHLKELHLRYNKIEEIQFVPENIRFLDIRNNSLWTLNESLREFFTHKSNTSSNLTMFIAGNPWFCHCKQILFFRFTKDLVHNIKDLCKTECSDHRLFVSLEEKDLCPDKVPRYVLIFTSFIMLSCLLSFLQCIWKSMRMWLYEKGLFLRLTTRLEEGTETKYDCFLAYCYKDSHFVKEYVERLEHGRNKLRLCFYERDWLAGEPIPDCICNSVENSKCTAILMTKNFLKSVWGRLEFRLALHATSKDQHKRLVVIVYPGVENFDELDGELQSYMKLNTYLMRSDANFWNKLIYVLPHKAPVKDKLETEIIEMESVNLQNHLDCN